MTDRFVTRLPEEKIPRRGEHGPDPGRALVELLAKKGLPARLVRIERAEELRTELTSRRDGAELDPAFDRECLSSLVFGPPSDFPTATSIVVAAVPRPETAATFRVDGTVRTLTIPPTYTDYRSLTNAWTSWLGAILGESGFRAKKAELPLKLLAARSGLARYGRNNISFIEGLGSYFELVAAFTDLPCENDSWQEASLLERCARCRACEKVCPTSAIRNDRVLIDADRCLVFHNERDAETPFPGWIDPSVHRTVIGCMECQWFCPENRPFRGWVGQHEEFSADETAQLLDGVDSTLLAEPTRAKLDRLDVARFYRLLRRNIGAAFAAKASGDGPVRRTTSR